MDIHRNKSKFELFLNQADYVEKVLYKFVMHKSKPTMTPNLSCQLNNVLLLKQKRRYDLCSIFEYN